MLVFTCHQMSHLLFLLCAAVLVLNVSMSSQDSHGRLNTKHLNKIFKRFSAFVQTQPSKGSPVPAGTTTESVQTGKYGPISKAIGQAEYRRSNDVPDPPPPVTVTSAPVNLFHEIKVSFGDNTTLPKPFSTTTQSYQTFTTTSTPPSATNMYQMSFSPTSTETSMDSTNLVTRPSDECKCVCRNGHKLETYDIELDELKMKILQAELLHESKTGHKTKIEDVLDSLVDEDESDYDDIDELEQIQKPTKYIPMEIIEISHRRPPNKPSTSARIPTSSTTTSPATAGPTTLATSNLPSTSLGAPLYSMSFSKPVSTLKFALTRFAQLGIPLLVTVALGQALTQIEMIDRSFEEGNDQHPPDVANLTINPHNYWNLFQVPLASGHGFYGPFFEAITPMHAQNFPPARQFPKKRKKEKLARKPNEDSLFKRWLDKLIY